MRSPVADRTEALAAMTAADLAWIFTRVPALAQMASDVSELAKAAANANASAGGAGPVSKRLPGMDVGGLAQLGALLGSPHGIELAFSSLNRLELQLTMLAAWHGGTLRKDQAVAETGRDAETALDAAAGTLRRLLLAERGQHWLRLRPGVADVVGFPGVRVRDGLAEATSEGLDRILIRLGEQRRPTRKAERMAALEARLRDRRRIEAAVGRLPADSRRLFYLLAEHGVQPVRDLGIPYYNPWHGQQTPLHRLAQDGLVGVDFHEQVAWVWLDVIVALNGSLFPQWPVPPAPEPQPVHDGSGGLPLALSRLGALLDAWAADPAPALASGGLGVRPVRAAAKAMGAAPGELGLLAYLAIELGLLSGVVTGVQGRGRNRTETYSWAPTELTEEWRAAAPAHRWALLVQAWCQDWQLDESEGLPERWEPGGYRTRAPHARSALLRLLAELPPGCGLASEDLVAVASFRSAALLAEQRLTGIIDAARVLGLVPADGPIGLTALGRALLDGPGAVEAALPAPRREFTVQADHTVIAPPDLSPDVLAKLERFADVESAAGARIYRLSELRIATALDEGATGEDVIAFLDEHSTVPLAQNVTHLVRDVQRRHGRLRVGTAGAYLRCEDPAQLTRAVGVKAAKLTLLAPTVAVSPLARDKLVTALRSRGLMPVAESPDGALIPKTAAVAESFGDGGLPEILPLGVLPDAAALEALAKSLLEDRRSR